MKTTSKNDPKGSNLRGPLLRLLPAATVLLVAWSFVVPIFEAPDETHHWDYALYLHDHKRLPAISSALVESTHPPLYYLLIAPFAREGAIPPFARFHVFPRFYENCYSDFLRYWPIRFGRFVSVFLSLITVLFTYLAAREMTGSDYTGILAASLTLLLPQFTFRGTNVSNDVGVTTMCAVTTYFVVRLFQRGFTWRTAWLASLSFVFAFLCKVSAIIFIPVVVVTLIYGAETWKTRLKRLTVLPISAVFAAPWLIRNQLMYGDPLAIYHISQDLPEIVTKRSLWSSYFLTTLPAAAARSFVGVFGYMNLYLPRTIYWMFGVLAAVATAGLCWGLLRRKLNARLVGILVVLPVLAVVSLIQFNLTFTQPQGRYLFPALPAIMLLAAAGLEALPHWKRWSTYALVMLFGAVNIYALIGVEFQNYWMPQKDTIVSTGGTTFSTDLMKCSAEPSPAGINDLSRIVGYYSGGGDGSHAFLTTPATVVRSRIKLSNLGIFRNLPGGSAQFALDLNQTSYNFDSTAKFRSFGLAGDIPVAGDWDGSGVVRLGVFRQGVWHLDLNNNGQWDGVAGGDGAFAFGLPGDTPVVGDWNGNGVSKFGVVRCPAVGTPGLCTWELDVQGHKLPDFTKMILSYGLAGDIPVVNDWSGTSNVDHIGVFRCPTLHGPCAWIVDSNGDGVWQASDAVYTFGSSGDVPIVGDWNDNRQRKRIGVFRNGTWVLDTNGNNTWDATDQVVSVGRPGDKPVIGRWTVP